MNVFELFATLTLNTDGFSQGLQGAKREAEEASGGIGNALGGIVRVGGQALLAGTAAAATGVATLTGAAVSSYGQYQQLMGGAELMFGEASDTVMQNAADAYATMALSQNEYLEQANRFATGLINDLDGDAQAAADLVNNIMRAEADVVAATGQDMEMVQNAFNGIMRNNYMMLDNLGLGIAPTKEGMQELIATVNEWNEAQGRATNYTIDSLADQEAALVDYIEMVGLSQYSSMEAGTTITGSIGAVGAAWQNLVTGLADPNADLSVLISRFITSAEGALTNLLPIIEQALTGVASLIDQVVPIISAKLPTLVSQILPPLLRAAVSIVSALVTALPSILSAITQTIPIILNELVPAIVSMLPDLVGALIELVVGLATALAEAAPILIPAVVQAVLTIAQKLTDPDMLLLIIDAAIQLAGGIAEGILMSLPEILSTFPVILEQMTLGIISMIPSLISSVISLVGQVVRALVGAIYETGGSIVQAASDLTNNMIEDVFRQINGLLDQLRAVGSYILEGVQGLADNIGGSLGGAVDMTMTLFSSAWSFIRDGFNELTSFISGLDFSLPNIALPHFRIQGGEIPWGIGGQGTAPSISVDWYAKAMGQPYLLNGATIFGAAGGSLLGGGETGGELIVGWDQLKRELNTQPIIDVHVYIGNTEVDDFVVDSSQRNDFISGGRG